MTEKKRYYDIDWLRVLGMVTIFLFHNARFFNEDDWHVKNFELDFGMSVFVAILDHFIMPLFFVLSAFAIYYTLRNAPIRMYNCFEHRTPGEFCIGNKILPRIRCSFSSFWRNYIKYNF